MTKKRVALAFCLALIFTLSVFALPTFGITDTVPGDGEEVYSGTFSPTDYAPGEDTAVTGFRSMYDGSLAHKIVARSIWYMLYGFTVYGHTAYSTTGYIDCSQYTSRVYKDFGYSITGVSRYYNTVGVPVSGVYSQLQPGSTTKWMLVGWENLKPGDILTWWKEDATYGHHIGHVGIYMGAVNGKPSVLMTISGRPTSLGVLTSFTYWYGEHFEGARRILPSTAYTPGSTKIGYGPVIPAVYQMPLAYQVVLPKDLPQGF
ncbi:MAG: NlpC/P60 family protein [Solirubrobacterales bacterium]